ncbi:hypothetical protein [Streptomyces sp. NPDC050388]|uniref:hypothetical protein n=1 Tax=Streptomyces sp. NPDC050388 TaxID=3155781 RepID=UPI00341BF1A5
MSTRRRIAVGRAVLCLASLAATSALSAEPSTSATEFAAGEAMPTDMYVVDCQEVADEIEQARAEAEREQREALDSSAAPANPRLVVTYRAVPIGLTVAVSVGVGGNLAAIGRAAPPGREAAVRPCKHALLA